jgi:hypothetical protein
MTAIGFILMVVGWLWCRATPFTPGQRLSIAYNRDYDLSWAQLIGILIFLIGIAVTTIGAAMWLWETMP